MECILPQKKNARSAADLKVRNYISKLLEDVSNFIQKRIQTLLTISGVTESVLNVNKDYLTRIDDYRIPRTGLNDGRYSCRFGGHEHMNGDSERSSNHAFLIPLSTMLNWSQCLVQSDNSSLPNVDGSQVGRVHS